MRRQLTLLGALLLLLAPAVPAQETATRSLTLEEFLASAFQRSPDLRTRRAEVEEARGRQLAARTYPFNPAVSVSAAGRRSSIGGSSTDSGFEVEQEIEVGGQRARRAAVADASLRGAEARYERERQLLASRVELAFAEAVQARELLGIEEADAALADDLLRFEEKRLEAGEATQIDLNLARAAAGRSHRRAELARGAYRQARSALAEAAGLAPAAPPEPAGGLEARADGLPPLAELASAALARRQDVAAFRSAEEEAQAQVRLQQSLAVPNLVARVFRDREAGTDTLSGAGFSVGIPLFNRNRGGVAEARAAADHAAAETAAARLAVEREVASALAAYQAASAAAEGLREQVIGTLQENLRLLQRSFEEGKIGRSELFLFRRELVDGQREYLDAALQARQARVRLELAAGRLSTPNEPNRGEVP